MTPACRRAHGDDLIGVDFVGFATSHRPDYLCDGGIRWSCRRERRGRSGRSRTIKTSRRASARFEQVRAVPRTWRVSGPGGWGHRRSWTGTAARCSWSRRTDAFFAFYLVLPSGAGGRPRPDRSALARPDLADQPVDDALIPVVAAQVVVTEVARPEWWRSRRHPCPPRGGTRRTCRHRGRKTRMSSSSCSFEAVGQAAAVGLDNALDLRPAICPASPGPDAARRIAEL